MKKRFEKTNRVAVKLVNRLYVVRDYTKSKKDKDGKKRVV